MNRRWCVVIRALTALIVLLESSPAIAEPLKPKVVIVEGQAGVWFPRDDADHLLDVVQRKVPTLEALVDSQGKLIGVQKLALRTATTALDREEALLKLQHAYSSTVAAKALSLAQAAQEHAQAETPLLERPWTNFGLGFVLGFIILLAARKTLE